MGSIFRKWPPEKGHSTKSHQKRSNSFHSLTAFSENAFPFPEIPHVPDRPRRTFDMSSIVPLNGLQSMMLRWEEFHAVNAIHLVQLGSRQNADVVHQVIVDRCQSLGLSPVEFLKGRRTMRISENRSVSEPLPIPFQHLKLQGTTGQGLEPFLEQELNHPFEEGWHWPIRFWFIDTEFDGQFLALNYQHAISDSRGISLIMRDIVQALSGNPPLSQTLDRSPPPLEKMLPERSSFRHSAQALFAELKTSARCFHHPRRFQGNLSIGAGIHSHSFSTATLKQTSGDLNVKVQDLLFAAVLEALWLHFFDDLKTTRRKSLGVYTPADLRRESVLNVDSTLGQILGCITVRATPHEGIRFRELVETVHKQTRRIKETKSYRNHASHMSFMSRVWDCLPRWANRVVGPYLIPLTGFISNVDLSEFLTHELANGQIQNYFRFSGTGILTPMMLGITTLGQTLNITTTHHQQIFSGSDLSRIAAHVKWRLSGEVDAVATRQHFEQLEPSQAEPSSPGDHPASTNPPVSREVTPNAAEGSPVRLGSPAHHTA